MELDFSNALIWFALAWIVGLPSILLWIFIAHDEDSEEDEGEQEDVLALTPTATVSLRKLDKKSK